jgi:hypothetical protein
MKKNALLILILPFSALINSCDTINPDIDIDTDLGYEYYFSITEQDPSTIHDEFIVFINDQDILDNLENIKKWKVNKITYQITSYFYEGTPDVTLSGTLTFGSVDVSVSNVNLLDLYVSAEEVALNVSDQDLSTLANEIKATAATSGIIGSISGEISGKPVYFNVYVRMYLTATAES